MVIHKYPLRNRSTSIYLHRWFSVVHVGFQNVDENNKPSASGEDVVQIWVLEDKENEKVQTTFTKIITGEDFTPGTHLGTAAHEGEVYHIYEGIE